MTRDMTKAQFDKALAKWGIVRDFCGYYRVTEPELRDDGTPCSSGVFVYAANAGDRRRNQLAYLISEQKRLKTN